MDDLPASPIFSELGGALRWTLYYAQYTMTAKILEFYPNSAMKLTKGS